MSELKHFTHIVKRAPRAGVVFLLTVFADLVVAVNIRVILAILHFLRRIAAAVEVQQMGEEKLRGELLDQGLTNLPARVLVYEIDGPFFFGQ